MTKEFEVTDDILATHGQRLLHYFVDLIIQYVIALLIGLFLGLLSSLLEWHAPLNCVSSMGKLEEFLLGYVIMLLYYSTTEYFFSRSIAKFMTNTVVVNEDGEKPDLGTILKRSLCRMIPFNHFSFLGGIARGWHDSIPDTYVVKEKLLKEAKKQFYELDEIGKSEE